MIKVYQLTALQNNYIVSIPFKGVKVRCEFKGGNIAKGIYARLYTNDLFKQMAIEQCEMNGKMWKLVEKVKEAGDVEPVKKPATNKPAPSKNPTTEPQKPADSTQDVTEPGDQETPADEGTKDFANLAEAILFIASTFGQQVETEAQARKVLKDNGIKAVIHKG